MPCVVADNYVLLKTIVNNPPQKLKDGDVVKVKS